MSYSNEELVRQNRAMAAELSRRDREEAQQRADAAEAARKANETKATAAEMQAAAEGLEQFRVGSWVNVRLRELAESGQAKDVDAGEILASVPKTGFPPGVSADDAGVTISNAALGAGVMVVDVSKTTLGRMRAEWEAKRNRK